MWSVHEQMRNLKASLQIEADQLSKYISSIEQMLEKERLVEESDRLREQLRGLTERYHDIEGMPTWPVDFRTASRFTVGNVALFIPVLVLVVERAID